MRRPSTTPIAAEASYDFWVCALDLQSGMLERLVEMEGPFCWTQTQDPTV